MTPNEFQALCARTANPALDTNARLAVAALGLSGESGEVADLIKKIVGHGHRGDIQTIIGELGDVLWYCAEMATTLGVELDVVMVGVIEKLKHRYPDGFSTERSINRLC